MVDLPKVTEDWIKAIQEYYTDCDNLTQIHARGYFAGMSEREILLLVNHFSDNAKKHPLSKVKEELK